MFFPITTCLLLVNAVASHAIASSAIASSAVSTSAVSTSAVSEVQSSLQIVSPAPGTMIQAGATVNVTLQIEKVAIKTTKQLVLAFGLNSHETANVTSLGDVFLGLINITHSSFNASGHLTWSLTIPAQEKLNSTATSFSLVVAQYIISGATHTPNCGLLSVPVKVSSPESSGGDKTGMPAADPMTNSGPKPTSDPSHKTTMADSSMNTTSSMGKVNMTKPEIQATVASKGHNTASTIPGNVATDKPAASPMKTNTTSVPDNSVPKTSSVSTPPPSSSHSSPSPSPKNTTATPPESESSGAAPLSISTSHLVATIVAISGIFATL